MTNYLNLLIHVHVHKMLQEHQDEEHNTIIEHN